MALTITITITITYNNNNTVTREMLTAVVRDQRWPDVVAGISVHFSKFALFLFCYITNHLMTVPLASSEFCFPRISMFPSTSSRKQNSLFPSGPLIKYQLFPKRTVLL